ncbi:GNAT family N-acetyltransferase [Treponema phagedenis]|uniref:Acetyltransferase, GNAT family n=1 Tax=Treponema phagedenis TaxID=162 RepID=A0A0B7GSF3_TREPH|nr:GNAT family N-acetyltransferase [Treponema phagedenis]QSH94376.1 GNAT family N-acetyltransferase [Treponema phagedenis]QSI00066.1 GNAT family N-acetyltransferase [Treponema phagedenis]CEM61403.1 Acetyltransferase, GNAT family [Treponema phagedenis]
MQYRLKSITKKNIDEAIQFIILREAYSINLAEKLRELRDFFLGKSSKHFVRKCLLFYAVFPKPQKVCGVLLLTANGILLHNIDESISDSLIEQAAGYFLEFSIHSIMGIADRTILFETLLKRYFAKSPSRIENYTLMLLTAFEKIQQNFFAGIQFSGVHFSRSTLDDAEKLLPLQIDYENTEVLSNTATVKTPVCLKQLKAKLQSEIIFHASINETPIAKAGTNAQGFNWNQIGGVYTLPAYRTRGLATALTAHLVRDRMQAGKNLALFVKVKNTAAITAYKKIGFTDSLPFRIAYFL